VREVRPGRVERWLVVLVGLVGLGGAAQSEGARIAAGSA
jgi:hypothetical protein